VRKREWKRESPHGCHGLLGHHRGGPLGQLHALQVCVTVVLQWCCSGVTVVSQ
jgi:hypothetical protein